LKNYAKFLLDLKEEKEFLRVIINAHKNDHPKYLNHISHVEHVDNLDSEYEKLREKLDILFEKLQIIDGQGFYLTFGRLIDF
jgi:hypothetical protein